MAKLRVGLGYDVHQFDEGRELWIGGIKIADKGGLKGHSDADVLIHAVCDAMLGAAHKRDIGYHFPDTSATYEGIDSKILLKKTTEIIREAGYEVVNIDATVIAQKPKMSPHIEDMQRKIAEVIGIDEEDVSVKATTTERLGFVGREEGIAAEAVVLIEKK